MSPTDAAAAWVYKGVWGAITRWFRIPDTPPELPVRPGEEPATFRPARGFLSYLRIQFWMVMLMVSIAIMVGWIAILIAQPLVAVVLLPVAVLLVLVPDLLAWVAIHLRYDTTWYVMTDRALRMRRGIWQITEVTLTFENVQNVIVTQGPLQRYFGIADVEIQTAGGGSGQSGKELQEQGAAGAHRGLIEGVANASEIRELILARLRTSKTAGLGDEETPADDRAAGWSAAHIEALEGIRDELAGWLGSDEATPMR